MKPIQRLILTGLILFVLLVVSVFGAWRWRLARDVKGKLTVLREANIPTSGVELDHWYAAVPDPENAALVMTQAFALMQTFPDQRAGEVKKIKLTGRGLSLTEPQKRVLTEYVTLNLAALSKAQEATGLSAGRYPIDLSWGYSTPVTHLNSLRDLAQIAQARSFLATNANAAETTDSILNVLGMAKTLQKEPLLISQLIRWALLRTAASMLENDLNKNQPNHSAIATLSNAFQESETTNLLAMALAAERATTIPYFRMSWAEIQRVSNSDDNEAAFNAPPIPGRQPFFLKATGFFERDLKFFLETMESYISYANQSPPHSLTATNKQNEIIKRAKNNYYIFSGLFLPALSKSFIKEAEQFAAIRLSRTALALEQFQKENGRWPATLSDLMPRLLSVVPKDPFDGQPLRYLQKENGYVIYSIGSDGVDNGGREKPARLKAKTEYDITFTVDR